MFQILNCCLIVLCLIYSASSLALKSDKKEALHIQSDSGVYNFKTGVDVYEGHVKVDQGSTHLLADKLITKKNKQHKIQEATAYGEHELAYYSTQPNPGDPEIQARARIIKFYPIESNITLEHEVQVTQGENQFQGELIHYNGDEQTIIVPPAENGRATLVYDPKK